MWPRYAYVEQAIIPQKLSVRAGQIAAGGDLADDFNSDFCGGGDALMFVAAIRPDQADEGKEAARDLQQGAAAASPDNRASSSCQGAGSSNDSSPGSTATDASQTTSRRRSSPPPPCS